MKDWKEELKKEFSEQYAGQHFSKDYLAIEGIVESLLKQQREIIAQKMIKEGWISKDGNIVDLILNAPEPSGVAK